MLKVKDLSVFGADSGHAIMKEARRRSWEHLQGL